MCFVCLLLCPCLFSLSLFISFSPCVLYFAVVLVFSGLVQCFLHCCGAGGGGVRISQAVPAQKAFLSPVVVERPHAFYQLFRAAKTSYCKTCPIMLYYINSMLYMLFRSMVYMLYCTVVWFTFYTEAWFICYTVVRIICYQHRVVWFICYTEVYYICYTAVVWFICYTGVQKRRHTRSW